MVTSAQWWGRALSWIQEHFRAYRRREPWDFCWRITVEHLAVCLTLILILAACGAKDRDMKKYDAFEIVFLGLLVAPLVETLTLQSFPVWLARRSNLRFSMQVLFSTSLFMIGHAPEGWVAALVPGLIGGFYLAFTYAHWRERDFATAYWTTALQHVLINVIPVIAYLISRD